MTPAVDITRSDSEVKRFIVGPALEIGLTPSWALEFSALYRRTGYSADRSPTLVKVLTSTRANSWEFPFLARWYPRSSTPVRVFFTGGYVVRHLSDVERVVRSIGTDFVTGQPFDITTKSNPVLPDNPTHGASAGGGLRFALGRAHIAPEVRYTRWSGSPFIEAGPRGFSVRSTQNQLDILVGILF